jgi:hypothetical protein
MTPCVSFRLGSSRTMFFEPLTCPSTLDRPPAVALPHGGRPAWRSFGAQRSRARGAERLSLSGGASSLARSSSSCASPFWFDRGFLFPKRRRRPLRVALASSCHAARELARAPPSEGKDAFGPAILVFEDMPARQRRGRRRFDKRLICGDSHVHWFESMPRRTIAETFVLGKRNAHRSQRATQRKYFTGISRARTALMQSAAARGSSDP